MKIFYLSDARLPTEKAHGLAIMKTCEALATAGQEIELIVPKRRNAMHEDPFTYYRVKTTFPLSKLFTLDVIFLGRLGFLIQEITFAFAAAIFLRGKRGVIYSRDDVILWILWLCGYTNFVWESHTGGWNRAAREVAQHAKSLVVISHGLKDFYVSNGIPAEKITVIPSAIDLEDFAHPEDTDTARERLGIQRDAKVAMYIGRLDGWKGSASLLEASKLLPNDISVVVIGGEPQQIEALSSRYPRVHFLGFRPYTELSNNQSAADVLVVPNTGTDQISARFTSPLKVVAHMASGRPIVASDLPSIRELTGEDAALLVPADDAAALASGIERLFKEPVLREHLVESASRKVRYYTWTSRAEKLLKIFDLF